jgi:hypothetical protein
MKQVVLFCAFFIFIFSTCTDMDRECNQLKNLVFHKEAKEEELQLSFIKLNVVDLLWGVKDEQKAEGKVLRYV